MCEVRSQGLLRPYSPSLSILGSFNPALSFVFIDSPSVWEGWYEYVLVGISMCACRFERVWKEAWLWKEVFLGCCLFLFEMGTLTQSGVYRICYAAWWMNFKISVCVSDPPDTCYRHAAGPGFHKGAGNPFSCPQMGREHTLPTELSVSCPHNLHIMCSNYYFFCVPPPAVDTINSITEAFDFVCTLMLLVLAQCLAFHRDSYF